MEDAAWGLRAKCLLYRSVMQWEPAGLRSTGQGASLSPALPSGGLFLRLEELQALVLLSSHSLLHAANVPCCRHHKAWPLVRTWQQCRGLVSRRQSRWFPFKVRIGDATSDGVTGCPDGSPKGGVDTAKRRKCFKAFSEVFSVCG